MSNNYRVRFWVGPLPLIAGLLGLLLVLIVACNEPTEVSISSPQDTLYHFDTTVVHDTTIEFVYDTTLITVIDTLWCKYRGHGQWTCLDVRPITEE